MRTLLLGLALFVTAVAADSCNGRCGTFDLNNYNCQCNDECIYYGNCCSDYSSFCDSLATCVGRNCYGDDQSLPCQCNSVCSNYGDCCPDYEAICVGSTGSCENRCGNPMDTSQSCQCNAECVQYGDCCSDYSALCSGTSTSGPSTGGCVSVSVSNAEIETASLQLWDLDVNSLPYGAVTYDVQSAAGSGDAAPNPFFTYVDESYLQTETFVKLRATQDNYFKDQGVTEYVTDEELAENDAFLDAVLQTAVGQYLYDFLDSKGLAGCDGIDGFKTILNDIWFGMYDRKAPHDTSGFEHSFVGEIKGSGVSGFHNWMNFYYEELYGNFNYQGWKSVQDPREVGMQHTWYGATKPLNGFTIGTSPEIEFALYTLCHLTRPNQQCSIQMADENGVPLDRKIQTYTWSNSSPGNGQKYVASAYFIT